MASSLAARIFNHTDEANADGYGSRGQRVEGRVVHSSEHGVHERTRVFKCCRLCNASFRRHSVVRLVCWYGASALLTSRTELSCGAIA
jgi:hypothetical protein